MSKFKVMTMAACIATTGIACATVETPAGGTSTTQATGTNNDKASGQVYHWYDGKKRRVIQMSPEFVADFQSKDVLTQAGSGQKSVAGKGSPVFVDTKSGKTMRALPGGIVVRFTSAVTEGQANELLKPFNTTVVRQIGATGKSWFVASEPGMESLELANSIYESGLVESAAPNWWKERRLK